MFDTTSEKIVTILGGLGVLFVGSSAWLITTQLIENGVILALINIFNHFILVTVALPFLLKTLFEQELVSKPYIVLLNIFSIMNAIFLLIISFQINTTERLFLTIVDDFVIFLLMSILELLPVYFTLYQITKKQLIIK